MNIAIHDPSVKLVKSNRTQYAHLAYILCLTALTHPNSYLDEKLYFFTARDHTL